MIKNSTLCKMTNACNIDDIFKQISDDVGVFSIYIDLDCLVNLLKIKPIIYKCVPSLRTKMIAETKTYNFDNSVDKFLEEIHNKTLSYKNKIIKIYLVTNNTKISTNYSNIIPITHKQFYAIDKINSSILLANTNHLQK